MHGIILSELKRFVEARHGTTAWRSVSRDAGLAHQAYLASEVYPDEDVTRLVAAAERATGTPAASILEAFGEFIAPNLLEIYAPLVRPEWRTLDLLLYTEETIHRVVRIRNEGARPPELRSERVAADEVVVTYASPRKMCHVAKGIVRGIAVHFGETVVLEERACMHDGAPACILSVRATTPPAPRPARR